MFPWNRLNDVSTATNQHATVDVLLQMVFLWWFMPRSYKQDEVKI
jgi:hypothetical protein